MPVVLNQEGCYGYVWAWWGKDSPPFGVFKSSHVLISTASIGIEVLGTHTLDLWHVQFCQTSVADWSEEQNSSKLHTMHLCVSADIPFITTFCIIRVIMGCFEGFIIFYLVSFVLVILLFLHTHTHIYIPVCVEAVHTQELSIYCRQ